MKIDENYLIDDLKKCYESQGSFVSGDRVILPSVNVAVKPEIYQLEDHLATLGYHIYSPEWKNEIFEISSALGSDTKTAVGMAQGSFMLGIMETVQAMMLDVNAREVDSDFWGLHKWKLYLGNVVAMGKEVPVESVKMYWDILKDEILKRIGNQEICYIKIYAANGGGGNFVTGECRINDMKIDSLSKVIEELAKTWNNKEFASHKQFFLLKQDKETLREYPYTNEEIYDAVEKSMIVYEKMMNHQQEDYYLSVLEEYFKDSSFAQDICNFIPEICAENAFDEVTYPETLTINRNGITQQYYKTQLADYYPIMQGVFRTFEKGILKDTNKVYRDYVSMSAISHGLSAALQKESKLKDLVMSDLVFNVSEDYIVR